jgi:hypothetical protein
MNFEIVEKRIEELFKLLEIKEKEKNTEEVKNIKQRIENLTAKIL